MDLGFLVFSVFVMMISPLGDVRCSAGGKCRTGTPHFTYGIMFRIPFKQSVISNKQNNNNKNLKHYFLTAMLILLQLSPITFPATTA